jgi:hypothetical protein
VLAKIAVLPSGVTVRWGHAAAGHQIAEVGVKQVQLTGLEVHDIKVQSCSRGLVSHSYAGNKRAPAIGKSADRCPAVQSAVGQDHRKRLGLPVVRPVAIKLLLALRVDLCNQKTPIGESLWAAARLQDHLFVAAERRNAVDAF